MLNRQCVSVCQDSINHACCIKVYKMFTCLWDMQSTFCIPQRMPTTMPTFNTWTTSTRQSHDTSHGRADWRVCDLVFDLSTFWILSPLLSRIPISHHISPRSPVHQLITVSVSLSDRLSPPDSPCVCLHARTHLQTHTYSERGWREKWQTATVVLNWGLSRQNDKSGSYERLQLGVAKLLLKRVSDCMTVHLTHLVKKSLRWACMSFGL